MSRPLTGLMLGPPPPAIPHNPPADQASRTGLHAEDAAPARCAAARLLVALGLRLRLLDAVFRSVEALALRLAHAEAARLVTGLGRDRAATGDQREREGEQGYGGDDGGATAHRVPAGRSFHAAPA